MTNYLRDPANAGKPLELSLDLSVQAASERVLEGGMKLMNAKGATSILMDVHTGEVISVVSLPSFDPNDRPRAAVTGDPSDSPLFNRSVQGVYELGSTFKIFAAAQAMELGLVNADTMIDTAGPMRVGGHSIGEFRNKNYGTISVSQIIEKSSNRGTGRLALMIGKERQQEFLRKLGLFEKSSFEIIEASGCTPAAAPALHRPVGSHHLLRSRDLDHGDASCRRLRRDRQWRAGDQADAAQAGGPADGRAGDAPRSSRRRARDAARCGGGR